GVDVFGSQTGLIRQWVLAMERYDLHHEFVICDSGMIPSALRLVREGLVTGHLHFDFVMGVPGGIPATAQHLLLLKEQLPPGATWTVAAIGRHQLPMAAHAITLGAHVRVGLEDNIYYR